MHPYRTNAKPEELPKKRPLLCRIGLHFWGGWALDGCGVFWCMRCDKYFLTNRDPTKITVGNLILANSAIRGTLRRCENKWALGLCRNPGTHIVQFQEAGTAWVLCEPCTEHMVWEEGPDVIVRPLTPRMA